ncbi:prepilin-type N-terminal cleavage/methylation domain-containing protein [Ramlibacter sp. H39-3-26]|uniref:PulJ/GspJ family protein n=1 Tax=Curvibacter soli TaxID=3031331 RepID=UPI0023DB33CB|nr:prepilin-type N-terminal cleavage/methylation domain-containing protein [Ramlibacter sp. H39-3-26]MDF1483723.1 prepilin-type N-terminal cleavage/methylation domain-containing protein [Ramlibacter sp. H39-3-26]
MRATAPRTQHGFTLVELLVALGVMALIAMLGWRALDGMARTQEVVQRHTDAALALQAGLGQWGADLDAMASVPHTVPIDWDGRALRITRRSSAVPDTGLVVAAWTRRGVGGSGEWLRWQSPPLTTRGAWQQAWQQAAAWAQNPGDAERGAEVPVLPLDDWQVFYFRGNAWTNPQSSAGTDAGADASAAPNASATAPEGVRLVLVLPPGQAATGRIVRDWAQQGSNPNKPS